MHHLAHPLCVRSAGALSNGYTSSIRSKCWMNLTFSMIILQIRNFFMLEMLCVLFFS